MLDNPVLHELLSVLRNKGTPPHLFRSVMEEIGVFIGYEVARELPTSRVVVETPLGRAEALRPRDEDVVLVGVLRAALPLVYGMARVLRRARIGFVSAKRIESSRRKVGDMMVFDVEVSYINIPSVRGKHVFIVDPMLATASTIIQVARHVHNMGPLKISIVSIISSKPGIARLEQELPLDVDVYTLAIDEKLNDKGFIVPGLGDAGDRAFNT